MVVTEAQVAVVEAVVEAMLEAVAAVEASVEAARMVDTYLRRGTG